MHKHLLLSVSCEDKPGVVEKLSAIIESCKGSWLESRLANLRGKFVGVIWISLPAQQQIELTKALQGLLSEGIQVQLDDKHENLAPQNQSSLPFSIIGPDRIGIVKEVSLALSSNGINLEELETNLSSAPYSGDPIFEAKGHISAPQNTSLADLKDRLEDIADKLGLDLDIDTE